MTRFVDFGVPMSMLDDVLTGVVFVDPVAGTDGKRRYQVVGVERLSQMGRHPHVISGRVTARSRVGKDVALAR